MLRIHKGALICLLRSTVLIEQDMLFRLVSNIGLEVWIKVDCWHIQLVCIETLGIRGNYFIVLTTILLLRRGYCSLTVTNIKLRVFT